jgi:pilus assembly protein CpaF
MSSYNLPPELEPEPGEISAWDLVAPTNDEPPATPAPSDDQARLNALMSRLEQMRPATQDARLAALRDYNTRAGWGMEENVPLPSFSGGSYADLRVRIQTRLLTEIEDIAELQPQEAREQIETLFNAILAEESLVLSRAERQRLFEGIIADILGFGPIEPLMADSTISAILINSPQDVFIERGGQMSRTSVVFEDDAHVRRIAVRMLMPLSLDAGAPLTRARLADGSQVLVANPPISPRGIVIVIRKALREPLNMNDLLMRGVVTADLMEFLRACIVARLNMLVVGVPGAGKTTLLNVLAGFIPEQERVIALERTATLQLTHSHLVALELPAWDAGALEYVLETAPDRLIYGDLTEIPASLYMNTCLRKTTLAALEADDADDALRRLEWALLDELPGISVEDARDLLMESVDLIVRVRRLRDKTRRVEVVEIERIAPGRYNLAAVFDFQETGVEAGRVVGRIRPRRRPACMARIEQASIFLPPSIFTGGRFA